MACPLGSKKGQALLEPIRNSKETREQYRVASARKSDNQNSLDNFLPFAGQLMVTLQVTMMVSD